MLIPRRTRGSGIVRSLYEQWHHHGLGVSSRMESAAYVGTVVSEHIDVVEHRLFGVRLFKILIEPLNQMFNIFRD